MGCLSFNEKVREKMCRVPEMADASKLRDVFSRPERPIPQAVDTEELDTPRIVDNSMSKEDVVSEGRLVKPSEQVLSGKNSAAAMLDFVPSTSIRGMEEFVEEEQYYENYTKLVDMNIEKVPEPRIDFPYHLDTFYFPSSVISKFPQPKRTVMGTYDYYCMDLASILPVLAMNIQPREEILDMCCAPGNFRNFYPISFS